MHPAIAARQEIHLLENQYQDQMRLYAEIKNQRTEQEDTKKQVERLTEVLMDDIESYKEEVFTATETDLTPSVIKDFIDQLSDMKKRFTSIQSMDDHEPPVVPITITEMDSDGEAFDRELTVAEFFFKIRRKLLHLKDKATE